MNIRDRTDACERVRYAVSAIAADGLILHRRNWLEIRDREGVVARSCECYRPLREKLHDFSARLA